MNDKSQSRDRGRVGIIVVVVAVIALFMVKCYPVIRMAMHQKAMVESRDLARIKYSDLVDFDQEFGSFPGDNTAVMHHDWKGNETLDLTPYRGKYMNDYMGQLVAANIVAGNSSMSPDYGGYSYIKNQSSSDNPQRPLLLSKMTGNSFEFDPKPYDDRAFALRIDGSIRQMRVAKQDGLAVIGAGKTLFQTGADTVWGEDGFDKSMLVHPDPNPLANAKERGPSIFAKIIVVLLVLGVILLFFRKRRRRHV